MDVPQGLGATHGLDKTKPVRARSGLAERFKLLGRALLSLRQAQREFQRNLIDWGRGGPKPEGWTRTGPPVPTPDCKLAGIRLRVVEAHDCLAKNRAEMERWHLDFLRTYLRGGNLRTTAYWLEYLLSRLSEEKAEEKAARFVALYESMAASGRYRGSLVWLADLGRFRPDAAVRLSLLRFDGAHRLACLYMLGIRQVPCMVFSLRNTSEQR